MRISDFKRDSKLAESGDWVDDLPGFDGVGLHVRGLRSEAYNIALAKLQRSVPQSGRLADGNIKPALAYEIMGKALADAVLLDWRGIEGADGKPLSYDADLAETWLTDPDFLHFNEAVMAAASIVDQRARIAAPDADAEKN
jgi:hypothetical protein